MHERFWVYIMASKSGTLYTGMTSGLDRRVFEHKQHLIPGFTAKYQCTRLVFFEEFSGPDNAIAREKQIKGWLRSKKIALIESTNPHWNDLAQNWGAQTCPPGRSVKDLEKRAEAK
jgi:putative endonuclease